MMIPLSSRRPTKHRPTYPQSATPTRSPYMQTALAFQLLPDEASDGGMGFLDHLDELRTRIIRSCLAIAIGMLVAFAFIDRLVAFVNAPARRMLPTGTTLVYTQPAEAFGLMSKSR